MTKRLFLCTFTLRETLYMNDGHEDADYSRIVWADDAEDAERIISEQKEFTTDEYAVYRNIRYFDASEVLGSPR